MRLAPALALAAALAGGCRTPPGGDAPALEVATNRGEYVPGDMVIVTTRNLGAEVAYDDHCGGEVQGYELLDRWNASYGMSRACLETAARLHVPTRAPTLVPIAPGAAHVDTFHVNTMAYAGTWRVELALVDGAGRLLPERQRVSNTFRVWSDQAP